MGNKVKTQETEENQRMEVTDVSFIFQEILKFKTEKNDRNLPSVLGIFSLNL